MSLAQRRHVVDVFVFIPTVVSILSALVVLVASIPQWVNRFRLLIAYVRHRPPVPIRY